ncbi:hypothetical protein PR202_gb01437 [Eleusine coracana subsp. coracana]|uniref:NADP-dependent oxidoreductase domain-containing protein n=1 Tax=Eleusine coracana subsp. coracana TaxID=191504 RepID=A0AAV5DWU4_ELECO|nr:hypothetical protein PR202_gb01437 [Eleusine coracana subsp. coracana]
MDESFVLNTGARIPSVGLGVWQIKPEAVGDVIYAAVKVGLALKKLFEDGVVKREDMFITSKLWSANHAPEDVLEGIDNSLKDLQLEYLDLYLIHGPIRIKKGTTMSPENLIRTDIPATWGAMEKLYDSGKARAIGVSNFTCKKLEDLFAVARVPPAVNQVECHPVWQQDKLRKLCQLKGVHLSAFSPLGSPGSPGLNGPSVLSNPVVVSVAEKLQKTPAQVSVLRLAGMTEYFILNTGSRIPSVGVGTSQEEPGVVGHAIYAAVKIHPPVRSQKGATPNPENFLSLDIPATWGAMEKLYNSRKARAIGVSNFSSKKMEDLLAFANVPPAVNQVESHPTWQQMKLRELCQSKAYSPLGKARSPGFEGPTVLRDPIVMPIA